jgi:hypothetical protein
MHLHTVGKKIKSYEQVMNKSGVMMKIISSFFCEILNIIYKYLLIIQVSHVCFLQ